LSTAALAAGTPRPLENNHDLRIGSPAGNPGSDGWARQGSASSNPDADIRRMADSTGATLQAPQPLPDPPKRELVTVSNPTPARDSLPTLPAPASPPGVNTFEQAKRELEARGVLWQRLDMVGPGGEWKYSCSIPNKQNPRLQRTYEAKANDPVAAIRAVLDQLDKEQNP
jgi:hypothetical protein